MSFLTDLFEGQTQNLGTDLSHAGSSLMSHPSELYETLGGAAALATGGLALGALAPEAGVAAGGGLFGDLFGGGAAAGDAGILSAAGGDSAALDAVAAGAVPDAAPIVDAASTGGDSLLAGTGIPGTDAGVAGGGLPGATIPGDPGLGGGLIGPPAPPTTPPSPGGFMSSLNPSNWTLGGIGKGLGVAAAGAGLGMNLLAGNKTDPNQQALQGQAAQMGAQGQQLESYLKHGTLPPALKAQLAQATAAEKARITAGYAARGMPTDPSQNSALAQELNNVDTNAVAAMAGVEMEMFNTGLKETGMSTQIYQMLTQLDMDQNKQLMQSISSFAAALGGGPTIKLPQGTTVA